MKKRSLSLSPLTFDEAVTDILKVKPEPKKPEPAKTPKPTKKKASRIKHLTKQPQP